MPKSRSKHVLAMLLSELKAGRCCAFLISICPAVMVEKVTKMVEIVAEWNAKLVESVRKVDLV